MNIDENADAAALNSTLMSSMRQRHESFSHHDPWQTCPPNIYKVPKSMRQIDVDAYEPKILSIGPYHRGKSLLEEMEMHKWRCLHDLLCLNPEVSLEMYLMEMKSLEEMARSFYSENVELHSNDFVEMMLLDGCFIVEFLMNLKKSSLEFIFQSKETEEPMFNTMWILPSIVHDILLLENQVPFFIPQCLFDLVTVSVKHSVPSRLRHTPTPTKRKAKTIPSATELQEAGVKFKKMVKKAGSFMEIEFSKGIMQIPQLYIYPNTNSFFHNLIAFEQCYPNSKTHFTAYAMFMDKFINSLKDVMLLKQHGIIQHCLGTDEELAFLFNQLSKGVNFYYSKTYLSNIYKEVKLYYLTDWHRWRANLMHYYFSNPWAFLSLVGALVLLLLTIAQTFLAFLSHYSKPSRTS